MAQWGKQTRPLVVRDTWPGYLWLPPEADRISVSVHLL